MRTKRVPAASAAGAAVYLAVASVCHCRSLEMSAFAPPARADQTNPEEGTMKKYWVVMLALLLALSLAACGGQAAAPVEEA
ncbi:MAG: hypothetical protein P8169_07735 [Chloroflexota bacterium]